MNIRYLTALHILATLTLGSTAYALPPPPNNVCHSGPIQFDVTFNGEYENAVIISQKGKTMMSFNNYYGKGAAGHWMSGAGSWITPAGGCYYVTGLHKVGTHNPNKKIFTSSVRVDGNRIGFEDASDKDFQDALIVFTKLPSR